MDRWHGNLTMHSLNMVWWVAMASSYKSRHQRWNIRTPLSAKWSGWVRYRSPASWMLIHPKVLTRQLAYAPSLQCMWSDEWLGPRHMQVTMLRPDQWDKDIWGQHCWGIHLDRQWHYWWVRSTWIVGHLARLIKHSHVWCQLCITYTRIISAM